MNSKLLKAMSLIGVYLFISAITFFASNLRITLLTAFLCFLTYLLSILIFRPSPSNRRNISLWPPFLIAFFFYNNTYPFILINGIDISYLGLETSEHYTAITQKQSALAFIIMCILATMSAWRQTYRSTQQVQFKPTVSQNGLIIGANIALSLIAISYFATIGGSISTEIGRVEIAQQFNLYLWVFLGWIHLLFYFSSIIQVSHTSPKYRSRLFIAAILIAIYCLMDAAIGGRKIIAAAMLGTIYGALRFDTPRIRTIMLILPIAVLAISIRAIFYDKFSDADGFSSLVYKLGGEFIFTFLTFPTTVASNCNFYNSGVSSYLMTFLQFIPRFFWENKPFSLAQSLSNHLYQGQEGFSIVLMAEAWCTFKSGAALAFPLIAGLLFSALQKLSRHLPIIGFLAYSHALELNRGEISYLVFQLTVLYTMYAIGGKILAIFRPNPSRATFNTPC